AAATHDDGHLHAELAARGGQLARDAGDDLAVDAVADGRVRERLARELQHHSRPLREAVGHQGYFPISKRAKRVMPAPPTSWRMVRFWSLTYGCSSRHVSLKKPFIRPSTILGIACSGLPSLRVRFSSTARSSATTSGGTSSRLRYRGFADAIWSATSCASAWSPPVSPT